MQKNDAVCYATMEKAKAEFLSDTNVNDLVSVLTEMHPTLFIDPTKVRYVMGIVWNHFEIEYRAHEFQGIADPLDDVVANLTARAGAKFSGVAKSQARQDAIWRDHVKRGLRVPEFFESSIHFQPCQDRHVASERGDAYRQNVVRSNVCRDDINNALQRRSDRQTNFYKVGSQTINIPTADTWPSEDSFVG